MKQELAAGAFMVVAEGRESGRAGIYRRTGEVRMGLIAEMKSEPTLDLERVLFEAPERDQQAWFIKELGSDVNLGNIRPDDAIALETLRLGSAQRHHRSAAGAPRCELTRRSSSPAAAGRVDGRCCARSPGRAATA